MSSVTLAFTDLETAFATARLRGWSTCEVSLQSARFTIEFQRVGLQPTRRGGPPIGILEPQPTGQAHPLSLSARYGLGSFPLHTDGANLQRTPEFTLLEAAEETDVPTLMFDLESAAVPTDVEHAFRNGVFAVGRGASSFYAHALDQDGYVRCNAQRSTRNIQSGHCIRGSLTWISAAQQSTGVSVLTSPVTWK